MLRGTEFLGESSQNMLLQFKQFKGERNSCVRTQRFNRVVLLAQSPLVPEAEQQESSTDLLIDNTRDLLQFAESTMKMLVNQKHKVYSKPVFPVVIENEILDADLCQALSKFSMTNICTNIKSEKQYTFTFDVVGHGTPSSIGVMMNGQMGVSPEAFARSIDWLFIHYELNELFYNRKFHFVFHTCNSAYVPVRQGADIFDDVLELSFIGRFYQTMMELGYKQMSVTGFRGYYCAIVTNKASSALVQNDLYNPEITLSANQAAYVINNGVCSALEPCSKQLTFPIPSLDERYQNRCNVESVGQKTKMLRS